MGRSVRRSVWPGPRGGGDLRLKPDRRDVQALEDALEVERKVGPGDLCRRTAEDSTERTLGHIHTINNAEGEEREHLSLVDTHLSYDVSNR